MRVLLLPIFDLHQNFLSPQSTPILPRIPGKALSSSFFRSSSVVKTAWNLSSWEFPSLSLSSSSLQLAAAGASIFANSTTNSLTGRCGSGVFTSLSGLSFSGVSFGGGRGGWLDFADDLEINFQMSTKAASIFRVKPTKIGIILAIDSCPSVLMSLSKWRALFSTFPGVPTTSQIRSRLFIYTRSWRISSFFITSSTLRSATSDLKVVLWASNCDLSCCLNFFNSLQIFLGLQLLRGLEAPLKIDSSLEYYPCSCSTSFRIRQKGLSLKSKELIAMAFQSGFRTSNFPSSNW